MNTRRSQQRKPPVIRISLPWMVDVSASIDALDGVQVGRPLKDLWITLLTAKHELETLFNNSVYRPGLRSSREWATKLLAAIELLENDENQERAVTEFDAWQMKHYRDQFRTVFRAELSILPVYLVTQKGGFDTMHLTEAGDTLFPPSMPLKAPETIADALEAGKAIAFELGTACGFHTFRVVESVVRRYWDAVSGGKDRPSLQTLGTFVSEMEKHGLGDKKVIESLKQLTRLHRNPLAHPEVILTVDEAVASIGMARSVITPMLAVLPDVPLTTGTRVRQQIGVDKVPPHLRG